MKSTEATVQHTIRNGEETFHMLGKHGNSHSFTEDDKVFQFDIEMPKLLRSLAGESADKLLQTPRHNGVTGKQIADDLKTL